MKYGQWSLRPQDEAQQAALTEAGMPALAARVLAARGLRTPEEAWNFLSTDPSLLHNPFALRDMDLAVERIHAALAGGEAMAVYGDYDVDGITSTCLLTDYLRSQGGSVAMYIPGRMEEGYGVSQGALDVLYAQGVKLVITVDCGITAVAEAEYARTLGMDLIITDHHECKAQLPSAVAVIDPHRPDCPYPFKHLAGVGVALKLVLALGGAEQSGSLLPRYADLAAIGTVADVMRLVGENRAIVRLGLDALAQTRRPGLRALLTEAGLGDKPLASSSIGYSLAPRINASGRMGCATLAAELLLTEDSARGEVLAKELCALNRERQTIELGVFEECLTLVAAAPEEERAALVLSGWSWHQGVAGIVASRLAEKFSCPAFMICVQDGRGKGSCRSFGGFNLFAALEACEDLLVAFGGHELAAGFTILEEQIPAFRARMNALVHEANGGSEMVSVLEADAALDESELLSLEEISALALLEPYGSGNQRPVFLLQGCTVTALCEVGGGRHLKLKVSFRDKNLDAIFFSATAADCMLVAGDRVDLAFHPQINEYRGRRSVQLQLLDLRPAQTRVQTERVLWEKYCRGEPLNAAEAAALTPSRAEFAGLWRYLKGRCADQQMEESSVRLVKNVASATGLRETLPRTMICLEVFHERGLLCLEQGTDLVRIGLNKVDGKVDLEQSYILQNLRKIGNC
jgi:single-stranded-DNA-specific exonuclease